MNYSDKTGWGEALAWVHDNSDHDGAECLIWPFARSKNGYGRICYRGERGAKWTSASHYMCMIAHGNPPEDNMIAGHSCDNGSKGCVNPKHLSWISASQNTQDALRRQRVSVRLSDDDIRQIRLECEQETCLEVSKRWPVSNVMISRIKRGIAYRWVQSGGMLGESD